MSEPPLRIRDGPPPHSAALEPLAQLGAASAVLSGSGSALASVVLPWINDPGVDLPMWLLELLIWGPGLLLVLVRAVAPYTLMLGLLGLGAAAVLRYALHHAAVRTLVRPGRIEFEGWFAPPAPRVRPITVDGAPGEPLSLRTGGQLFARLPMGGPDSPWDEAAVAALLDRLHELLQVPIDDRRDRTAWAAWLQADRERSTEAFEAAQRDSLAAFPAHHAAEPFEPPGPVETHRRVCLFPDDGRQRAIALKAQGVRVSGQTSPYERLDAIAVCFAPPRDRQLRHHPDRAFGRLRARIGGRIVTLVATDVDTPEGAGGLLWTARELERLCAQASGRRTERVADPSVVPAALRQLRAEAQR